MIDESRAANYIAGQFTGLGRLPLEYGTLVIVAESILRVILGCRFLSSGISNVRRWPNPVRSASLLFPTGAPFFGFVATALMLLGGAGVALGFQTPLSSAMLIIFLIPTFNFHLYWLKVLPTMAPAVKGAIQDEKAQQFFQTFNRQSFHSHEVGIEDNLVLLAAAIYFAVRGSGGYGVDNLMSAWVLHLF